LRDKLEEFKRQTAAELDMAEIERWMIQELGVEIVETGKNKAKRGTGSIRTYYHPAMEQLNVEGYFTVHVMHKKRLLIRRPNFRAYLYKSLVYIVNWLESGGKC
jgi:hypothetical protein